MPEEPNATEITPDKLNLSPIGKEDVLTTVSAPEIPAAPPISPERQALLAKLVDSSTINDLNAYLATDIAKNLPLAEKSMLADAVQQKILREDIAKRIAQRTTDKQRLPTVIAKTPAGGSTALRIPASMRRVATAISERQDMPADEKAALAKLRDYQRVRAGLPVLGNIGGASMPDTFLASLNKNKIKPLPSSAARGKQS